MPESNQIARNPPWRLGETQRSLTGYVGLVFILMLAFVVLALKDVSSLTDTVFWDLRKIFGFVLVFAAMAFVELFVFKVYKRNFDFSQARVLDWPAKLRIWQRAVVLFIVLIALWGIFLVTNIWFPQFTIFFYFGAPLILFASPVYFYLLEKYGIDGGEEDELLICAKALFDRNQKTAAQRSYTREHSLNLIRGIFVKGFFIPFMVVSCITFWNFWEIDGSKFLQAFSSQGGSDQALIYSLFFKAFIDLIILIDVTIAALGYLTSCRLLDTHFTSVEPTLFGWLVAVCCYPPFNKFFEAYAWKYASYELTNQVYVQHPVLSVFMAVLIVVLMSIYCWSTVVFGLRFSNLTNRGIISSGPYSIVRHPAYASKNLSWWLALGCYMMVESKLMIVSLLMLIVINVTYFLRALTEEKHLIREEHYKQYCAKVKWRMFPGIF